MSLSIGTHAIRYLASVILLLSFLVCTIQLPTYVHAHSGRETISVFKRSQQPVISNPSQNLRNWSSNRTTTKSIAHFPLHSNASSSILRRLTFLNPAQPICASLTDTNMTLMLIVLSNAIHFNHRQAIRATWGRTGKHGSYTTHVKAVFFVGTDDRAQTAIRNEQALFGDVVEIGKSQLKNDRRRLDRYIGVLPMPSRINVALEHVDSFLDFEIGDGIVAVVKDRVLMIHCAF